MKTEDALHDALHDTPGAPATDAAWAGVRTRAHTIRRRRSATIVTMNTAITCSACLGLHHSSGSIWCSARWPSPLLRASSA